MFKKLVLLFIASFSLLFAEGEKICHSDNFLCNLGTTLRETYGLSLGLDIAIIISVISLFFAIQQFAYAKKKDKEERDKEKKEYLKAQEQKKMFFSNILKTSSKNILNTSDFMINSQTHNFTSYPLKEIRYIYDDVVGDALNCFDKYIKDFNLNKDDEKEIRKSFNKLIDEITKSFEYNFYLKHFIRIESDNLKTNEAKKVLKDICKQTFTRLLNDPNINILFSGQYIFNELKKLRDELLFVGNSDIYLKIDDLVNKFQYIMIKLQEQQKIKIENMDFNILPRLGFETYAIILNYLRSGNEKENNKDGYNKIADKMIKKMSGKSIKELKALNEETLKDYGYKINTLKTLAINLKNASDFLSNPKGHKFTSYPLQDIKNIYDEVVDDTMKDFNFIKNFKLEKDEEDRLLKTSKKLIDETTKSFEYKFNLKEFIEEESKNIKSDKAKEVLKGMCEQTFNQLLHNKFTIHYFAVQYIFNNLKELRYSLVNDRKIDSLANDFQATMLEAQKCTRAGIEFDYNKFSSLANEAYEYTKNL